MAKLNLCIMVHVEDSFPYLIDGTNTNAPAYARLGSMVANQGGKMSWQFDSEYFRPEPDGGTYPGVATSMSGLLANGHNFWVHNHCATYAHLHTTWAFVSSAFEFERGSLPANPTHVIGRSGGTDLGAAVDWVGFTYARGLRAMNAPTQRNYDYTPTSFRPMGYNDNEIAKLHGHERAPGNTNEASGTSLWPNQRPIWMDTASRWDLRADTINAVYSGAVVMFPQVSNFSLEKLADGGGAFSEPQDLTTDDFNAALTQIWSTYQTATMMNSVNNIWYIHLPPTYCLTEYHSPIEGWVMSINKIMEIGGAAPLGVWRNMNEITSLAFDPVSRYH